MGANKAADDWFRLRADELIDDPAVPKSFDGGDAAHVVAAGQRLILIGVDLGQQESGVGLGRQPLQQRPQHATGAAPRCPKIDNDQLMGRALEHLLIECRLIHFDYLFASHPYDPFRALPGRVADCFAYSISRKGPTRQSMRRYQHATP